MVNLAGFGTSEASRVSRVSLDTIDYWARSGFLPPSVRVAQGKGSQRRYDFADLVALRVAGQLRQQGITLQALRRVVEHLRARGVEQPLAGVYLVSDGVDVFERRGDQLISTLRQPGQGTFGWIVDLGGVVEDVRAALAA